MVGLLVSLKGRIIMENWILVNYLMIREVAEVGVGISAIFFHRFRIIDGKKVRRGR